ncbi:MAG: phasin family protein [Desulfoarculaceae bacterium]|nr:phasin family protein [Desulfoarculaceae bacterium]
MIELIKKAMLTGLGMASLTKDKIEEIGRDFIEQGKLSQQEGEKLMEELRARAEESKLEIKKQIEQRIEEILKKMDLVRKSDLDDLKQQIKELQESHAGLEKKEPFLKG